MTIRLLLVEDDAALAGAIANALGQTGYTVRTASTAAGALRYAQEMSFDAGILDLGLPDRDGLELLKDLRAGKFAFPILILSARDTLEDRVHGLNAGSDDYLVKPFAVCELEARLRALLRRSSERSQWRGLGLLRCDFGCYQCLIEGREIELTKREFVILESLMRRPGKIIDKDVLFHAVFPMDSDVSSNALESHVSRLRQKLRPARISIQGLRGLGYRIVEADRDAGRT